MEEGWFEEGGGEVIGMEYRLVGVSVIGGWNGNWNRNKVDDTNLVRFCVQLWDRYYTMVGWFVF